jgi:sensory rhodopsin
MNLDTLSHIAFMLGFVAMAAGTFYFFMERGDLKPEHRSAATYAGVITFIAAIMYWTMKDMVGFPTPTALPVVATMPVRYLDWVLTTPLLLVEFGIIAAICGVGKGMTTKLVLADLVMIVFGYLGEVSTPGAGDTWAYFIISTLGWLYIVWQVWGMKPTGGTEAAKKGVENMKKFVIFGWMIYPLGTAIQQFMTMNGTDAATVLAATQIAALIYVIADVVNKVGFGMVAVHTAKHA